jgi:hypothetical protein
LSLREQGPRLIIDNLVCVASHESIKMDMGVNEYSGPTQLLTRHQAEYLRDWLARIIPRMKP